MKKIIEKIRAVPRDKKIHFGVGFFVTIGIAWIGLLAAAIAVTLTIGLSLGKEYGDSKSPGNKWDWLDIAAALGGMAVALIIALPLHYLLY